MTYSIIGTGGIGGYYGGRLARHGHDVHFLLHSDYEYVKANGLRVDSVNGDFRLDQPQAYDNPADLPLSDVVLVCLKTTNNHLLPSLLSHCADEHTVVVLIQNGIGVEEDIQQQLPHLQLVAGLAFICTAKVGPGHINHQCYGQISLGSYSCTDDKRLQQIADDFTCAGMQATIVEYQTARWRKAVWNMPFNGMTVALGTQTDLLLKNPATRQLIREQMMEIVCAARHQHIEGVDEEFVEKMIAMTDVMTPYSPSMKLDYDFHRPMEIKYLYSRPLQIAREAGMPMPKLEMLEAELLFLQEQRLPEAKRTTT